MPRIFTQRFTVPDSAIDALGHVNNQRYIGWMQDVAVAHSAAQGWPMERYRERGGVWVVRSHSVDYLRPARAGEEIELSTWVAGMTPRGSLRKYLFQRVGDGRRLVTAETLWVYVDAASGRPRRVPEDLRQSFELLGDEDAGEVGPDDGFTP